MRSRMAYIIPIWDVYDSLWRIFGVIMPNYLKNLTRDYFDILAYGIGGIILYSTQKVRIRKFM
jgi:hypothetical protein